MSSKSNYHCNLAILCVSGLILVICLATLIGVSWKFDHLKRDAPNKTPSVVGQITLITVNYIPFRQNGIDGPHEKPYDIDITYQFTLNERNYTGKTLKFRTKLSKEELDKFLIEFPIGTEIRIYYQGDPITKHSANPQDFLHLGGLTAVIVVLSIISCCLLLSIICGIGSLFDDLNRRS